MKNDKRTVKIGEHRGGPRLWLEGKWLHDAGFEKGMKIATAAMFGEFIICRQDSGDRIISGKAGNKSVIDIALRGNAAEILPAGTVAVVTVTTINGGLALSISADRAETLARHIAEDPHCTCPDCMEDFAARVPERVTCGLCGKGEGEGCECGAAALKGGDALLGGAL